MKTFLLALNEISDEFSGLENAYDTMLLESNVKWVALFVQIIITSILLQQIVIQVRGLNGSMGALNQIFSWMVLANWVCNWLLVVVGYLRESALLTGCEGEGNHFPRSLIRSKNILGGFVILVTSSTTALTLLLKALGEQCGDMYTVLDLQYCYIYNKFSYENFLFLLVYIYFFNEVIPMPISFTLIGMLISFLLIVATITITFDHRLLVSEGLIIALYLTFCYIIVDRHLNKKRTYLASQTMDNTVHVHKLDEFELMKRDLLAYREGEAMMTSPSPSPHSFLMSLSPSSLESYHDSQAGRLNFGLSSGSFEIEIDSRDTPSVISEMTDDHALDFNSTRLGLGSCGE